MFTAFTRKTLPALCLFICISSFSQQPASPKTLLWRISGKGLTKPSFLYGTMHLQDKRLFQFGDSVYSAIQNTDGLATEVDFREYLDTLVNNSVRQAEKEIIRKKQKLAINRKQIGRSADSLLKKFGVNGNSVTKDELKKIRDYRLRKYLQDAEMPTIMDAFLMGLALRQDKWTGGIEDVVDQTSISDEVGSDLNPDAVLQPETNFQRGIEEMIKVYAAQDLDKVEEISNAGSKEANELLLTHRNIKMAYRMDSLAAVRPTFFAIGVAHLPGDAGVIRLLRSRGFTVEPVFSASKTDATTYASHLKKQTWKEVRGDEALYTVQMPGQASDIKMFGDLLKMKFFFDFTTMTFYMVGNANGYNAEKQSLDTVLQSVAKNMKSGKAAVNATQVINGGLRGKETYFGDEACQYRLQLFSKDKSLFLLMAGSPRGAQLKTDDANRFFTSFTPGNTNQHTAWQTFSVLDKAFQVYMPGTPVINTSIDNSLPENSSWRFTSYQSVDAEKGAYFLAQVRQLKEGYFLNGDSAYFDLLTSDYKERVDQITKTETTTFQGFPALYVNYSVKSVGGEYKSLHVIRGNRVYVLTGGAPKGSNFSDIDSFLHSFTLLPNEASTWTTFGTDGFTTTVPASIKKMNPDSTSAGNTYSAHYYSYNPHDAVSYEVFKVAFSPTYWATDDSSFYAAKLMQYKTAKDSVLRMQRIQNGSARGMDYLIQLHGYSSLKRVRLLINKDTLYSLFAMLPASDTGNKAHEQFFRDFRIQNEVTPTLYTSKAKELLQALTSTDSLQFANASTDLDLVNFSKSEQPLLHESLLQLYIDKSEYASTHFKLVEILLPFADSSTVSFVAGVYPTLSREKERVKYHLLALLAQMKTGASYALLKQLLQTPLPTEGNTARLQYALQDSLALTESLFPGLLQFADDRLLSPVVVAVTNQLLDSNRLTPASLLPFAATFYRGAENALTLAKQNESDAWHLLAWTTLLQNLHTIEANHLLRQFLQVKDVYLKQEVLLALLKNGQVVPAAEMTKVAADKSQRSYFYRELQKIEKASLFPAVYATQQSLAESEVYNLFTEDYDSDFVLTYIGQRMAVYKGTKKLFHLFKARLAYDGETKKNYLAVAGPYEPGAKEIPDATNATGFYGDEPYQPQKTDALLKAYLLSLEPAEN